MSKNRLIITAVVLGGRSQADVASDYAVSKGWVSKLVARYRNEGDAAFEPRSRRPKTSPRALDTEIVELILHLRRTLHGDGMDAGCDTIRWHLEHHHHIQVSTSTIHRYLRRARLVTPAPAKKPRSTYTGSKPNNPTSVGSPTSPTGDSPMAPTSRCSPGSMTTHGPRSRSARTDP